MPFELAPAQQAKLIVLPSFDVPLLPPDVPKLDRRSAGCVTTCKTVSRIKANWAREASGPCRKAAVRNMLADKQPGSSLVRAECEIAKCKELALMR